MTRQEALEAVWQYASQLLNQDDCGCYIGGGGEPDQNGLDSGVVVHCSIHSGNDLVAMLRQRPEFKDRPLGDGPEPVNG